jgi:hypothetical protein
MMKKLTRIVLFAVCVGTGSAAEVGMREYVNPRFGFALRYPEPLVAGPERPDGSGSDFQTPDGRFRIEVYAKPVGSGSEYLNNRFNKELEWFGRAVTYKVKKPTWYVVSGINADGTEFYSKGYTNGSVLTSFRISYPHAEHQTFDRWVTRIEKNFVPSESAGSRTTAQPANTAPRPPAAPSRNTGSLGAVAPVPAVAPAAPAPVANTAAAVPPTHSAAQAAPPNLKAGKPKYPVGKPVPNKPGFVLSPYSSKEEHIDVRGFPPGTEVKDPYSGKIFLVP